jgi:hypothetical protein
MDIDHPDPTKRSARASRGAPVAVRGLTDAAALAARHAEFEVPKADEIRSIKPGDFVKLRRNKERFWVEFTGYEGRRFHGSPANDLLNNDDIVSSNLYFTRKNIYRILKP